MCLEALPSFFSSQRLFSLDKGASNRGSYGLPFLPSPSASSLLKLRAWCSRGAAFCSVSLSHAFWPLSFGFLLARIFAKAGSFHDRATCKSESRPSTSSCRDSFPTPFPLLSVYVVVLAERRHDLRGGKDGLRPRHIEGRRKEVLLQQPDYHQRKQRPREPPLVFAVLQQSAVDEEPVPGPPAGTSPATGIHQGDNKGESKVGASAQSEKSHFNFLCCSSSKQPLRLNVNPDSRFKIGNLD